MTPSEFCDNQYEHILKEIFQNMLFSIRKKVCPLIKEGYLKLK